MTRLSGLALEGEAKHNPELGVFIVRILSHCCRYTTEDRYCVGARLRPIGKGASTEPRRSQGVRQCPPYLVKPQPRSSLSILPREASRSKVILRLYPSCARHAAGASYVGLREGHTGFDRISARLRDGHTALRQAKRHGEYVHREGGKGETRRTCEW